MYVGADDRSSFGSFALAFALPGFVNRMKDFGAGFEMQERLAMFQEINFMRTLSRVAYAICFVCPSLFLWIWADGKMIDGADSLSKIPRVMSNDFAQTFLPVSLWP